MQLELTLFRLLKHRDKYEQYHKAIPPKVLDERSATILKDFGRFFAESPDCPCIPCDAFLWQFRLYHPTLSADKLELYNAMLRPVFERDCPPEIEAGLLERLLQCDTARRVADVLEQFEGGGEVDIYDALSAEVRRYEDATHRSTTAPLCTLDVDALALDDQETHGLHWRMECLNRSIKPLRGGDFVIVAARPDRGKTTFIASEITCMAAQFDAVYGADSDRLVLWMNNEGEDKHILERIYQAALGINYIEMRELAKEGALEGNYLHAIGGKPRIKLFSAHDRTAADIESYIRSYPPGLIVLDMIDNIKVRGVSAEARTDQVLEAMYQWARNLAIRYQVPLLATSQLSADAEGQPYPTMASLKDSRTGKQGAADVIITIGSNHETGFEDHRFINTPKNKRRRAGAPALTRCEVILDADRARFHELAKA